MEILVATSNAGKVREMEKLVGDFPLLLRSLNDYPEIIEPEETGTTFAENARLKAVYYAKKTGLRALADDSGLEVKALGGEPGVYSARFAGASASDQKNIALVLERLKESKSNDRTARFVCAMTLAEPNGTIICEAEGICPGDIIENPKGSNGFGYDPIFVPEGYSETFAELSQPEKQRVSHRGRAAREIIRFLQHFINL